MEKLIEIINIISLDELDIIIKNFNKIEQSNIDSNISNQIISLQKVPSYFKKTQLNFLVNNTLDIQQQLKLYFIEDWKDMKKFNKIKILLLLESLDKNMFNYLIGGRSKKNIFLWFYNRY
jgi:succinate dehydrogenase flavin-adding protein (antitoxin of CptAB toxin-antitoxin module)